MKKKQKEEEKENSNPTETTTTNRKKRELQNPFFFSKPNQKTKTILKKNFEKWQNQQQNKNSKK